MQGKLVESYEIFQVDNGRFELFYTNQKGQRRRIKNSEEEDGRWEFYANAVCGLAQKLFK